MLMNCRNARTLVGLSLIVFSLSVFSETAVVVHPSNNATISNKDIEKLYLGKLKKFPGGSTAIPLDRTEGSSIRVGFVENLVGKSESQMKSYWSRLVFSGKANPPQVVDSDNEVKEMVARNPDTIGYIDASAVDGSVKVVAKF